MYRQPSVIIRGYYYTIRRVLNRLVLRCAEIFYFMANEIAGFGGLNFFSFAILSELRVKCVLTRVWWVCENFRGPMEMLEHPHQCLVCDPAKIFVITEFSYPLFSFATPPIKLKPGLQANIWEILISKPPGPIIMFCQSKIIFITLFTSRCTAFARLSQLRTYKGAKLFS